MKIKKDVFFAWGLHINLILKKVSIPSHNFVFNSIGHANQEWYIGDQLIDEN